MNCPKCDKNTYLHRHDIVRGGAKAEFLCEDCKSHVTSFNAYFARYYWRVFKPRSAGSLEFERSFNMFMTTCMDVSQPKERRGLAHTAVMLLANWDSLSEDKAIWYELAKIENDELKDKPKAIASGNISGGRVGAPVIPLVAAPERPPETKLNLPGSNPGVPEAPRPLPPEVELSAATIKKLRDRSPRNEVGCFLCKWIIEDMKDDHILKGSSRFPFLGKLCHLLVEFKIKLKHTCPKCKKEKFLHCDFQEDLVFCKKCNSVHEAVEKDKAFALK